MSLSVNHSQQRALALAASVLIVVVGVAGVGVASQPDPRPAAKAKPKLKKNSVGTKQLKNGAVTAPKLATGAITSNAIANGAVTAPKLATGAVTSGAIAGGAVGTSALANGSVTGPKLAPASVGTANIVDGSVTEADLASGVISPDTAVLQDAVPGPISIGTSPTEIAELTGVPNGAYLVLAKLWVGAPTLNPVVTCTLDAGAEELDRAEIDTSIEESPLTLMAAASLNGQVELSCSGTETGTTANDAKLEALRVASVTNP